MALYTLIENITEFQQVRKGIPVKRTPIISLVILVLLFGAYGANSYLEINRLKLKVVLFERESALLRDEIKSLDNKPSYDQGYTDAVIRMGVPKPGSGAFAEGYYAALKTLGNSSYAQGYHNAIAQFGYTVDPETKAGIMETGLSNKSTQKTKN